MKFRKKPVVIEATQWFKNGDHPEDKSMMLMAIGEAKPEGFLSEGKIVRYFRHPDVSGKTICSKCRIKMHDHGWIDTLEDGHNVCPGDWIITGIKGEHYPCKPDIFKATYEPADLPAKVDKPKFKDGVWLCEHIKQGVIDGDCCACEMTLYEKRIAHLTAKVDKELVTEDEIIEVIKKQAYDTYKHREDMNSFIEACEDCDLAKHIAKYIRER